MSLYGWIALAFAVVLAGWQWDHNRNEVAALEHAATAQQQEVDRLASSNSQFAQLLIDRHALDERLGLISVQTQTTNQTLAGQGAQWRQAFAELKRNDDQVRVYLAAPVPVALGLRYARPATTDPLAWGAGQAAPLSVGGLPTAGPPGAGP
jgi:hypothetical protein